MSSTNFVVDWPVAFSFEVVLKGANAGGDNAFQEVSGLVPEMDVETFQEGGENHRWPKSVIHPNLVLKRGIANRNGGLVEWCRECREVLEGEFIKPIKPIDIDVNLLNEKGEPCVSWSIRSAWPIKWSISSFDAEKNALAIETIELAYNEITRSVR